MHKKIKFMIINEVLIDLLNDMSVSDTCMYDTLTTHNNFLLKRTKHLFRNVFGKLNSKFYFSTLVIFTIYFI